MTERQNVMFHRDTHEALARLARFELDRAHPASRDEARRLLTARMGAYEGSSTAIASGINAYFADAGVS